jgi:hypothetical protein
MRCSYVVLVRWMVIYGYEVPEGALNLSSTQAMITVGIFPFKEIPHGRTENRTRDLMSSSQKF